MGGCTTTVQDILDQSYATSKANVPMAAASESGELRILVGRTLRRLYSIAARVNPAYFGDIVSMQHNGTTGWPRPQGAEAVFMLKNHADNSPIVVVDWTNPKAEYGKPCVLPYGQIYRPAGNASDPATTVVIDAYYSISPAIPTLLTSILHDTWDMQHDDFLVQAVGYYLAKKDKRMDEIPLYQKELTENLTLFVAHLEHADVGIVKSHSQMIRFNSPSLVSLTSILMGGGPQVPAGVSG